jgi:hypothetical protein
MKLPILAAMIWACSFGLAHADDICPNGAVYSVEPAGKTVVVKRFGIGESEFAPGKPPLPGMALDLVTDTGERGALFGPMRSSMFITDPDTLTEHGYKWRPVTADPGGVYGVVSDDGETKLYTLYYVGCAP